MKMDIYHHLVENINNNNSCIKENKTIEQKHIPDKKFYVPQDIKDIQKQRNYKEKRNKNHKEIVGFEKSHLIFQRPWKDLNKAQKMNRVIEYAKQNNLEKHDLLLALEKRKISEINYDLNQGKIIDIILKE